MDKTTALATQILAGVGGEGNILKLENCMTRVRVEVSDEQRLDLAALKQLSGVKGYIKQGEQHQFIVGPGAAAKVVDSMRALLSGSAQPVVAVGDAARIKAQAKQKYAAPMSGALKKLADVFIPLIPAFIASGLITGIINLLKRPDIAGQLAVDYPNVLGLLAIFGSAVFAIMNILVGVNAARVFGGSQAMGGVMAGILSSPALAQITLFGEALQPGRGGVIAVLLVVALMCWVEKRLRALLPESVELILNPLLTTLVTASLAILILQPIGGIISDAIAHGANLAIDKGGLLVGALLSGLFLPLVLSGLHQGLV
ncbi:PTS transporter subunit EIIC, partial [Serratia marcescens]